MQIIVYIDPNPTTKQTNILNVLNKRYTPMVDAVNGRNMQYLKKNYGKNSRFFFLSEFLSHNTVDELDFFAPDFSIAFNDDEIITDKDWICVERFVESLFFSQFECDELITENANRLLKANQKIIPQETINQTTQDQNEHYQVSSKVIEKIDTCLIQVEKPFCDLPYTIVIRDYKKRGLVPFFTGLFICPSWGVSKKDVEFLAVLWKQWNMPGEFDLENMLKEAVAKCYPSQESQFVDAEPEVYRRSLNQVLEKIAGQKELTQKDEWNDKRIKRRRLDDAILKKRKHDDDDEIVTGKSSDSILSPRGNPSTFQGIDVVEPFFGGVDIQPPNTGVAWTSGNMTF